MKPVTAEWQVLAEWSDALQAIVQGGHLDVFTAYGETAAVVADHALQTYQGYLKGQRLPNGASVQHPSGNLAKHATLKEGPGFCDYSLENDAAYAEAIEKGTKQRDLKEILPTAEKARRAKDGSLYLIIPFRHGTQQNAVGLRPMPSRVYAMAQALRRSSITGHRMEPSVTRPGQQVERNVYSWGDHLTVAQLRAAGASFREQNRYAGMYKFGEPGHSSYVTFRVMSSKSPGWILPARPGIWAARTAAQVALQDGESLLKEALWEDLNRMAGI